MVGGVSDEGLYIWRQEKSGNYLAAGYMLSLEKKF
jgi:hypothetical protein